VTIITTSLLSDTVVVPSLDIYTYWLYRHNLTDIHASIN
jgi:hypothetical protein